MSRKISYLITGSIFQEFYILLHFKGQSQYCIGFLLNSYINNLIYFVFPLAMLGQERLIYPLTDEGWCFDDIFAEYCLVGRVILL